MENKTDRLTISFWIWGPFDTGRGIYHDSDRRMKELRDRGFNCVRMESGAGMLYTPDGKTRGKMTLHAPFGCYTDIIRQSNFDPIDKPDNEKFDIRARLLEVFRAAKKYGIRIILSSWYYLHTNWFFDDEINDQLFALTDDEKMEYFTRELAAILSLLRDNDLLDTVAFAELFNEFEGLPFTGEYSNKLPTETAYHMRDLHEAAIDTLKAQFPTVKFAFDISSADCMEELFPRNADIINCHCYYLWGIYEIFQHGVVNNSIAEPVYPPETEKYLVPAEKRVTMAQMLAEARVHRTGIGWNSRAVLYQNLDLAAIPALEKEMEEALVRDEEIYFERLKQSVEKIIDKRDRLVPGASLVMGEGVTYCCHQELQFEEHSRTYWKLLERQQRYLREMGYLGTVVRTTSGPEDPSWEYNAEDYRSLNSIFQNG